MNKDAQSMISGPDEAPSSLFSTLQMQICHFLIVLIGFLDAWLVVHPGFWSSWNVWGGHDLSPARGCWLSETQRSAHEMGWGVWRCLSWSPSLLTTPLQCGRTSPRVKGAVHLLATLCIWNIRRKEKDKKWWKEEGEILKYKRRTVRISILNGIFGTIRIFDKRWKITV